jgi:hypothetical protein
MKLLAIRLTGRELALAALTASLVFAAILLPTLPQDQGNHLFADTRAWLGIPNAQNVLSNLLFVPFGLLGLAWLLTGRLALPNRAFGVGAALFFFGFLVTAAASAWYHAAPADHGLVLDRLGMVLAFAGTFAMLAAGKISARAGWAFGALTLCAGPATVLWWIATGNLAPYVVVQFGGMLLLLLAALFWRDSGGPRWGWVLALYAAAKMLEVYDYEIYVWSGGLISGHALKHLVAACTALAVILPLVKTKMREPAVVGYRQTVG